MTAPSPTPNMFLPRFFAAVLSLSAFGSTLIGGDEGQAEAAARRSVRTTAGRGARARRSNDLPSDARRANRAPKNGAKAKGGDEPPVASAGDAARGRASADASAATADPPGVAKDTPRDRDVVERNAMAKAAEKTGGRGTSEGVSSTKSVAEGVKVIPNGAPGRSAEARSSAAKTPTDTPSSTRSTTEKIGDEQPATETAAATSRFGLESAASGARRELAVGPGVIPSARSVVVVLEGPTFDGGDVPRAAAALDRMKAPFAHCASTENAFTKNEASIDLRFLVRAPGRAEGVDVDKARGLSADVVRCMTSVLARSYVGAPSDDPVGVAFTVRMRKD